MEAVGGWKLYEGGQDVVGGWQLLVDVSCWWMEAATKKSLADGSCWWMEAVGGWRLYRCNNYSNTCELIVLVTAS
jgi:hypothetical protein